MGFWGFRVEGLGLRVQGSGFWVLGLWGFGFGDELIEHGSSTIGV